MLLLSPCSSIFNDNILTLDIAKVMQLLPEMIPYGRIVEDANARNFHPLLRARGERPRGRACRKRDEFAPSHCHPEAEEPTIVTIISNATEGAAMSALGQKQTCAAQNGMSALPPKADMCSALADVVSRSRSSGDQRL